MPVIKNTTINAAVTNKNVPIDCTKVIPKICFPDLAIFYKMISRPIITPAKHSRNFMKILYHKALVMSRVTTSARYGPKTIPAISQPRIAGSFNFETSLPQIKATQVIAKMRRNHIIIIIVPAFLSLHRD